MKFINNFLVIILLSSTNWACNAQNNSPDGFTIDGYISDLNTSEIIFAHSDEDGRYQDTINVTEGRFEIKGNADVPQFVMLYSPEARFQKVFYVENKPMAIRGSKDSLDISGSPIQDDYEVLWDRINANRMVATRYYQQGQESLKIGDSLTAKKYDSLFNHYYQQEREIKKEFILEYADSYVSLNELLVWTNDKNIDEAKKIYSVLDTSLLNTKKGQELTAHLKNVESVLVGKPAASFEQKDVDGNMVKLADYEGKYVLLEFWASWCGPCRAENPNLRAEYLKYQDKGFNVLGISLDDKDDKWRKAVEKDDLPWTQVSDLKGFDNQVAKRYGIKAIPANFLVDPNGKIVATNLRGDLLGEKLEEIFGGVD